MAAYDAREEAEAHAKAEERASEAKAKAEERAVEAKEKAEAAAVEAEDAFARAFRAIDYCEKKHAGLKGPELEENLNKCLLQVADVPMPEGPEPKSFPDEAQPVPEPECAPEPTPEPTEPTPEVTEPTSEPTSGPSPNATDLDGMSRYVGYLPKEPGPWTAVAGICLIWASNHINNAQTGLRIFGFVVLVAGMVASIPILVEPWREFFVKITG